MLREEFEYRWDLVRKYAFRGWNSMRSFLLTPLVQIVIQAPHVMCKFASSEHRFPLRLIYYRPAHSYTYTFEPNPHWKSYYAVSGQP
jgi:hypothetical protein